MNTIIHAEDAPAAIGPYVQGILADKTLYVSGQLGMNCAGELAEGVAAQAEQSLKNLGAILKEAGASFGDVVKTTVFLADMADFAVVTEVYGKYFADHHPARACIQVAGLPKGGLVEIECIAVLSK